MTSRSGSVSDGAVDVDIPKNEVDFDAAVKGGVNDGGVAGVIAGVNDDDDVNAEVKAGVNGDADVNIAEVSKNESGVRD